MIKFGDRELIERVRRDEAKELAKLQITQALESVEDELVFGEMGLLFGRVIRDYFHSEYDELPKAHIEDHIKDFQEGLVCSFWSGA